jgi:hypothetical protein
MAAGGTAPETVEGVIFERFSPVGLAWTQVVRPNHIGTFAPPEHRLAERQSAGKARELEHHCQRKVEMADTLARIA